jgi:hypothetical protein
VLGLAIPFILRSSILLRTKKLKPRRGVITEPTASAVEKVRTSNEPRRGDTDDAERFHTRLVIVAFEIVK